MARKDASKKQSPTAAAPQKTTQQHEERSSLAGQIALSKASQVTDAVTGKDDGIMWKEILFNGMALIAIILPFLFIAEELVRLFMLISGFSGHFYHGGGHG